MSMALTEKTLTSYRKVKHKIIPYELQIEGYLLFQPKNDEYTVHENRIEIKKISDFSVYDKEFLKVYKNVKQRQESIDFCKEEFSKAFFNEGILEDEVGNQYGCYSTKTLPPVASSCYCKYWFYDAEEKLSAFSNELYVLCKYFDKELQILKYLIFDKDELSLA